MQVQQEVQKPRGVLDVAVSVDEAGHDRTASQPEDAGMRPHQRPDLGVGANRDDAVA